VVYKQLESDVPNIKNLNRDEVLTDLKKVFGNNNSMKNIERHLYLKLDSWKSIRKKLMRLLLVFKIFNLFIKKNHGKCLTGHP